jgi:drug/metabolite transporter (DMT)-like permease
MWAIEPALAKLAHASSDIYQTVTIRAVVTALTALLYAILTNRGSLRITGKQLSKLVYIALVGTVFADLLYFYSLTKIPVINAVLIGHMQPVFVVLIGFLVLKEDRLTRYDYLGILILIIAGLLVSTRTPSNLSELKLGTAGDAVVLLATFAWATAGIVMRKYLRDVNAGVLTFYRFTIAAGALLVITLLKSSLAISSIYQVLIGVVVGVGYILYYEGLRRIKAAQAAALELSTPFFAALLGFLILSEIATAMQMVGIAFLFVGVYFLSKREELPF